jgi:hypothetical protein
MARKKSDKILLYEKVKAEVEALIKPLEPIKFLEGNLYVVDKEFYQILKNYDDKLSVFKDEKRRNSIFTINSIVSIINPDNVAIAYHLTATTKYKLITNRDKIIDRLPGEKEISKNKILKSAHDKIEEENLEGFEAKTVLNNAKQKVSDEEEEFNKIKANPDDYDIIISTFKEKKQYPQINYKYMGLVPEKKGSKKMVLRPISTNAHISIEKPSVLVFDENAEIDEYRSDMMVARYIKQGYRALGNVFVRLRKKEKNI